FTSFGSQDTAFFEIATLVGGSALATICTLIIAVSGISTGLAGQSAGSRILFGMGRDKVLPKFFAHVHEKYKTPSNSIIILAILGYVGALFLPLDFIFSIMVKIMLQHNRSEEHTSELQSRFDLVCRLLLEKKNEIHHKQSNKKI